MFAEIFSEVFVIYSDVCSVIFVVCASICGVVVVKCSDISTDICNMQRQLSSSKTLCMWRF